jgi:hypothetical protein
MYTFGNVVKNGIFVKDGHRYRRIPKSKFWNNEGNEWVFFNAVSTDRDASPQLFFEEDEAVDDIPWRPYRKEAVPLEDIFREFEQVVTHFRKQAHDVREKEKDPDLAEMYEDDADSLEYVLTNARDGHWNLAYSNMRRLDTAVRERIPREMYDEICEHHMMDNQ